MLLLKLSPVQPDEKRINKFVFIGRNLDHAHLEKSVRAFVKGTAEYQAALSAGTEAGGAQR